jgi:hypothetical protein
MPPVRLFHDESLPLHGIFLLDQVKGKLKLYSERLNCTGEERMHSYQQVGGHRRRFWVSCRRMSLRLLCSGPPPFTLSNILRCSRSSNSIAAATSEFRWRSKVLNPLSEFSQVPSDDSGNPAGSGVEWRLKCRGSSSRGP